MKFSSFVLGATVGAGVIWFELCILIMQERYPEIKKKYLRKAFFNLIIHARGKVSYAYVEDPTEYTIDLWATTARTLQEIQES